jgi:hypothetical protein
LLIETPRLTTALTKAYFFNSIPKESAVANSFVQQSAPGAVKPLAILAALAALATLASVCVRAEPSVYPTGTTIYNPRKAYNSFVLFTGGDDITRLIDLDGNVAHQWSQPGQPSVYIDPALIGGARGHIFVRLENEAGRGTELIPGRPTGSVVKTVGEVDWDGKIVWSFGPKAPGGKAAQHHDISRLPNGDTLVLANQTKPIPGFSYPESLDDVVYEVDPKGEVVWSWTLADHLEELGLTEEDLRLVRHAEKADYFHVNNLKQLGPNHWFDAGDKRFAPDNLIFDSREANVIAIIERASGKIVWSLGPHYAATNGPAGGGFSKKLPRPVDQISGQHDAQLIAKGLPGAGNLLVFDNQGTAGYPTATTTLTAGSRVVEIDPVKKEIVWQYSAANSGAAGWTFRSTHISSARRLPNGATLIDEGQIGRFFQVTPQGEIVWEYINAFPRHGKDPETGQPTVNYNVYRAQPVPYDWAPEGTPHGETAVTPPDNATFHVTNAR